MIQYLFTMETLTKAKKNQLQYYISMNEIMNKFLLAGDKFMPEMHLTQPGFTYSACAPFTKKKERIQKFKETSDSRYIFQNKLYKACFHHCVAYVDFKNLPRKTVFDKILHDIPFNIAKILKYDGYQLEFASTVNKVFDKNSFGTNDSGGARKFHKPIIKKFENQEVHLSFKDSVWGANMQVIEEFGFSYVLLIFIVNMHRLFL